MSRILRSSALALGLAVGIGAAACAPRGGSESEAVGALEATSSAELATLTDGYIETYFQTFPSRATAAGRHDLDRQLENLGADAIAGWIDHNRATAAELQALLARGRLDRDDRLDADLLLRQARTELLDFDRRRIAESDPLFWTGLASGAVVYLVVREDRPESERLAAAAARAALIPRLVAQAKAALANGGDASRSEELCSIAARQARASARFYSEALARATSDPTLRSELADSGAQAAAALHGLAKTLDDLGSSATGSPRLGDLYRERFALVVGSDEPVGDVLERARAALGATVTEAARFGRQAWSELMPGSPPADDHELLSRLFRRIGDDHASDTEEFVRDYEMLVGEVMAFVNEHEIATPIGALTLHTDRSPSYFVGQSVGGVYPAGPYDPEADTLFYLPTPPDDASATARTAFFRDFNHHFNVMIAAHEIAPGHYLQLKAAAHLPRKVRFLFGDGPFTEGWGTFSERLMLDAGWGDSAARLAHLKKRLENIARTIVDIEVHTGDWDRERVVRFVQEEALQEGQFASNMWTRSITSAPQLTFYWVGGDAVETLFDDVRAREGDGFSVRRFVDRVLANGGLPVSGHRQVLVAPTPR